MESYSAICSVYDDINKSVDYKAFADLYERCFADFMKEKPSLVLDLGCGTGVMTEELDTRGYDMTGIDLSPDMLCIAKDRAYDKGRENNILYLLQDMTAFELYGTVDACVCTLDGMNYLTADGDIEKTLACVHNYLVPDGLFVFDVSSRYRFEKVYANNTFVYDGEVDGYKYFCTWQNMYDRESELCEFSLTVFNETDKKGYIRSDELQYQRMYTEEFLREKLIESGFEVCAVYGDCNGKTASEEDERLFLVAKCIKK